MNCLVLEGPGQGGVLYTRRIPLRPDSEAVITPVIDWLLAQDGVDPDAVILFGRSFAGYLAPRAATSEHRLAALICDPAQYDFGITCPTLALAGEGDFAGTGQLTTFTDALTAPVTAHEFTAAEGAGGHCEGLGQDRLDQFVYGWLTRTLADRPAPVTV